MAPASAADNWSAQAVMTRRRLVDRTPSEGLLVLTYHFAFPGLGRVRPDGDGWLWEPTV